MRQHSIYFSAVFALVLLAGCAREAAQSQSDDSPPQAMAVVEAVTPPGATPLAELPQTAVAWRERLTPEQYGVTRERTAERPFTNAYFETKEPGVFRCIGCGVELFSSEHKYDSGTGWPSFWQPTHKEFLVEEEDNQLETKRTEVHCRRCGAHLGYVFDDGPPPTGLRYRVNSAALRFEPTEKEKPNSEQGRRGESQSTEESLFDEPAARR